MLTCRVLKDQRCLVRDESGRHLEECVVSMQFDLHREEEPDD